MTYTRFKARFDAQFSTMLTAAFREWEGTAGKETRPIFARAWKIAQGGKRFRPYLLWCMYTLYKPAPRWAEIVPLLAAVEAVHLFCLIQDDVMDEACRRHGTATMHHHLARTRYRHTARGSRAAESQAILVGDLLLHFAWGRAAGMYKTHPRAAPQLCAAFTTLVREVCLGQILDVDTATRGADSAAVINRKNHLKTARYSVARPLELGALAASSTKRRAFIYEFGTALGELYQLNDDLADVIDYANREKPRFQDVVSGTPTLLTAHVRRARPEYAAFLSKCVEKKLTREDTERLAEIFHQSGAVAAAQTEIAKRRRALDALLARESLTGAERARFTHVATLLTGQDA